MNIVQSWKKNSGFTSYTLQIYLTFQTFIWLFEFKVILKLFPEQLQSSGILSTRDILRTLSVLALLRFLIHSKSWKIENPRHIQNTVNLQNTVSKNSQLSVTLRFRNQGHIQNPIKYLYNGAFCSEPCVTLAYLESCYIGNLRNVRNPVKHLWCSIF